MTTSQFIYGLIKGLHDLFTVLWIGGLFIVGMVVMPVLNQHLEKGQQLNRLAYGVQSRLRKIIGISIIGLFLTGIYLARMQAEFIGLFNFSNRYSILLTIKMIVVLIMVGVMIVRGLLLKRQQAEYQKVTKLLMITNMALGLVVLLLSGYLSV